MITRLLHPVAASTARTLLLVTLLSAGTGPGGGPAPLPAQESTTERLDRHLENLVRSGFSGAVLVADTAGVVLERGYGMADDVAGIPVTAEMPFLLGSLSKQFTAAAILALEGEGKLSVDDRLGRFFPAAPRPLADITLHRLLTHTAGLPYLPSDIMEVKPREEVFQEMLALPVEEESAGAYRYSSPGYTLLAGVVERASGMAFEEYLHTRLFQPAGLAATGFMGDARWRGVPQPHSYSFGQDEGPLADFPLLPKAVGSGSVVSTVGDLHRWLRALHGGRVLPAASVDRLFRRYVQVGGPVSHGYGWNVVTTSRDLELHVHAGDLGGYGGELRFYPADGLTIALLSNRRADTSPGWRTGILNELALIVAGQEPSSPKGTEPSKTGSASS